MQEVDISNKIKEKDPNRFCMLTWLVIVN